MFRGLALALALVACTAQPSARTFTPAPPVSGSPSESATPTPGPLATQSGIATLARSADGTLALSIPDCVATRVAGQLGGCEVIATSADRSVFVATLRYDDGTIEGRAIDLATGSMGVLRARADLGASIDAIRDDNVLLLEADYTGAGSAHVKLSRVPWRDPAKAQLLDELDLVGIGGGDTWNPFPSAKTNGRDVVWLHAGGLFLEHEIVLQPATGAKKTVLRTDHPVWFDIDDSGRVAIAAANADATKQELWLWDGVTLRRLGSRDIDAGGFVVSFDNSIGWAHGYGTVRPASDFEIVPIDGGSFKTIRPESGCAIVGGTAKELVSICGSGSRLINVTSGVVRDGPKSRIVLPFPRALVWRMTADLAANPEIWRVTFP